MSSACLRINAPRWYCVEGIFRRLHNVQKSNKKTIQIIVKTISLVLVTVSMVPVVVILLLMLLMFPGTKLLVLMLPLLCVVWL